MNTETDIPSTEKPVAYADTVNAAITNVVKGENGGFTFPEDTPEHVAFAATAELRRRDTQSSHAKLTNENTALAAENTALANGYEAAVISTLTTEQQTELDELKAVDPDAWRIKVSEYEENNRAAFKTTRTEIKAKANTESETEYRTRAMTEFATANPNITISDKVLAEDVPPRYSKQLEAGEITFEEFLNGVGQYLTTDKVIKPGEKPPGEQPNLNDTGGSATPTDQAVEGEMAKTYDDETY